MFKKLKDKLAEEVKSSPQRIQLFAQAAQAAVTSASSSISDITNSDLFSIGDNDSQQPRQNRPPLSPTAQHKTFQDVSLMQSPSDSMDFSQEMADGPRQRRLSNSSFASDISFRLPSYETPSMYHLQSDMEVSASEADDRGFSGGPATLERVTKEQLYAAYKRTQERYKKYRTQYGDLARHYKLLERENAKARSVLVETQDKALRRISELKEQCSLEQSAKAHLEKALRVEIEEKGMKIEALNTKVQFLQNNTLSHVDSKDDNANKSIIDKPENDVQLINLDNESNVRTEDYGVEVSTLNNKIDKMEQLLNKYKESLKSSKEKNSQLTTELQILSKELENKDKQISELKISEAQLSEAKSKIQELNNHNEELQNQINSFDFNKTKEQSTLELDLQKANDEIAELRGKIEVFNKREEEYAISLAENKLSIHKELEGKEAEIKSLKDILSSSKKEMQSLKIVVDDYKNNISVLEEEKFKLSNECAELNTLKNKLSEMDSTLQELSKKSQALEQLKTKADEEYKCLQLQLKQETAEKLAMIDRNTYLETKNSQISEENMKKNTKISSLESQLQVLSANKNRDEDLESEKHDLLAEMDLWKQKCSKLELEIQDEREELVKLQTEIEKLLLNHELIQTQNAEFRVKITNLTSEITQQQEIASNHKASINFALKKTLKELKQLRNSISETSKEAKTSLQTNEKSLSSLAEDINNVVSNSIQVLIKDVDVAKSKYDNLRVDYDTLQTAIASNNTEKTENISKFEDLLKENENLKLKLTEKDSYIILANQKLEDSVQKHDSAVHNVESLKKTNEEITKKLNDLEKSSEQLQLLLDSEKAETIATVEKIKSLNTDKQKLDESIQALEAQNKKLNDEITQLKEEHKITLDNVKISHEEIMKNKEEIIKTLTLEDRNQSDLLENIHKLDIEKNELNDTIKSLELHNKTLQTDVEELNAKHEAANIKLNELNKEMLEKADILVKTKQELTYLQNEVSQHANTHDTISELEHVKQNLLDKLKLTEDANEKLKIELAEIKEKHNATEMQIQEASLKIIKQSDECAAKQVQIHDLEERIRNITQENICLQSETVNFASSIKKLESEIEEIKISHAEMETEKDRLNRIIEELEGKQKEDVIILKNDQDSQTEAKEDNLVKDETSAILENKWVMEHKQTLSSTASLNLKKENLEDLYEQYSTLKMNYDTLKDENRRLQSDIEGLQSYLTKISKENSVLNDKLRETIASSENSSDSDQLSTDVKELRNEIQLSKEKINDLQRENSLLVEENLELRDQLQSQNYAKPAEIKPSHNDSDLESIKVKYNELLQANSNLEKQNIDLEQINKSFNSNMQQIQEKNERLKLSNEKLERRLDEALVSLRHLHSLQENTELEYLRNILYEYLTGSGTHSVTLAKVLAAIVKFDDVQTQLVLQKEKERQGFLRQLGII